MRFLKKILISYIATVLALLVAGTLVSGFSLSGSFTDTLLVALIFTLVAAFLGPLLRIVSFPILILTLGLFGVVINMVLLYGVDKFSEHITINGLLPLFLTGLILTVAQLLTRIFYRIFAFIF